MSENTNTERKALMKLADAYADASFDQGLYHRTLDDKPEEAREELKKALSKALEARSSLSLPAAGQEPYCWTVSGGHSMFRGKYAKQDALNEAKQCGGTAVALPLYAAPQPAVAAGWVMVPLEPTEEMLANVDQEVGGHCHFCSKWRASYADCRAIWADMLSALPPAQSTEGESNG